MKRKLSIILTILLILSTFPTSWLYADTKDDNKIKKSKDGYYELTTVIDGVKVRFVSEDKNSPLLKKENKFYKEQIKMLQKLLKEERKKEKKTKKSLSGRIGTQAEAYPEPPPEPDYEILNTDDGSWFTNNYDTIQAGIATTIATIAGGASFVYAKNAKTASFISGVASLASYTISETFEPDYTTTKLVRWYSDYYEELVYQNYIYIYQDKYRNEDELIEVVLSDVFLKGDFDEFQDKYILQAP